MPQSFPFKMAATTIQTGFWFQRFYNMGNRFLRIYPNTDFSTNLSSILELDDQLQLGASLLLADADDGQGLHGGDRVPDRLSVRGVHLLLPHLVGGL